MSSEDMIRTSQSTGVLPVWTSVLAVVAHPDDESFGLGAILDAFTRAGARGEVLCLTHGEASTLTAPPETSPRCARLSWPRRPTRPA
jgi:LmbE family N-acetylglucosaminyl deacetylase